MVSDLRTTLPKLTVRHPQTVLYTAAHSGFALDHVPLGGGATVCARLIEAWSQTQPFKWRVLSPDLLANQAPQEKDLVRFSEREYAQFCFKFGAAVTEEILKYDSGDNVVLINDISEGPNFRLLAERGYRLYTIYHVDVVDYFNNIYLRRWVKPETSVALYHRLEHSLLGFIIPKMLKLVFTKQRESLLYSQAVIVPSQGMKLTLLCCYPEVAPNKIQVIPWGSWDENVDASKIDAQAQQLRQQYQIPLQAPVLLTLSRLSPEKGQDRLLETLRFWEAQSDYPEPGVWFLICGEAAFMKGVAFQKKLERMAKKLKRTRVIFPGYVTGLQKQAHFRLADLYVFPSRHESYGLTLLEALRAGLPALACQNYGSEGILQPEFGIRLPAAGERELPKLMLTAIRDLLKDRARLKAMGVQARAFAQAHPFSESAARLSQLLQ